MDIGLRENDSLVYFGLGVDITGSTTRYAIRPRGGTVSVSGTAGTASAALGTVTAPGTALTPGVWEAELEVTYQNGVRQTHPSDNEPVRIVVSEELVT